MSYQKPGTEKINTGPTKPTMDNLKRELVDRCQAAGLDVGFAKYFWTDVCSPYNRRYEQPHLGPVQGVQNTTRWVEPYAARLWQSLHTYIALSDHDRQTLHAGVADGVQWRGEHMDRYLDICNETAKMKQTNRADYMRDCVKKLNQRKQLAREESSR